MASYTTRVELHDAITNDYTKLHKAMERKGLSRTITSDDNVTYHLPTAEYNFQGTETRKQVLNLAKQAASTVKPRYAVLVTESKGRTWHDLEEVDEE
jgi:glucosamine 6-phosphate synthetase-like amidotransferase/phosphosugar isomerase protein